MTNQEGIQSLKNLIQNALLPLIGKKCALYDVPFYKNIGDVLIWQGELSFLEDNEIDIVDYADYHTYKKKQLSKDVTILVQGGGNIGDLYHEHVDNLLRIITDFPNNRIIVLSQTVFYKDKNRFERDFNKIKQHKDLYFCARDQSVYSLLQPILKDKVIALPDMAFCINQNFLFKWNKPIIFDSLYIRRTDVEAIEESIITEYDSVTDWPCFETKFMLSNMGNTLYDRLYKYIPFIRPLIRDSWKNYAYNKFRLLMIKDGVEFISPFKKVVSERLHGCILSILLNKEVTVVNNSYGKNLNFYNSWLKDFDDVKLLES